MKKVLLFMLKLLKIIAILVVVIMLLVMLGVLGIKIYHTGKSGQEQKLYCDAYGNRVQLDDGRTMNLCVYGKGDEKLVILPGLGSISPGLEYKGLAQQLSDDFTVIIVEPFGYGLSDITDEERTSENICSEIHEALNKAGYSEYNLMAHSIAGEYAISYIKTYPDEVRSFIGIDISVPKQANEDNSEDISLYKMNNLLTQIGVMRVICNSTPDEDVILPGILKNLTPAEIWTYRKIASNRMSNKNIVSEVENVKRNFSDNIDYKFPRSLRVLMLVSDENVKTTPYWKENHEELIYNCENHKLEVLDGGHYLHLDCQDDVAGYIINFFNN